MGGFSFIIYFLVFSSIILRDSKCRYTVRVEQMYMCMLGLVESKLPNNALQIILYAFTVTFQKSDPNNVLSLDKSLNISVTRVWRSIIAY